MLAPEILAIVGRVPRVLDGTLGGGGHALAFLESGCEHVTGIDRDPDAIASAGARLAPFAAAGRFRAVLGNYADVGALPALRGERFDAILLDLGISSHQIDATERGFSFRAGAPLDMRMGEDATRDAATFLNEEEERTLVEVFRFYGDEPRAGRLAREVVRRRATRPFVTSDDLVGAIRGALGPRSGAADFARLFQAVRIAVNDELSGVARALPALRDVLTPEGVFLVIAYHSGEDRQVKRAFRDWSTACTCPPRQPVCTCRGTTLGTLVTRKAVIASPEEQARNPRSRSARLRAWRRAA